MFRTPVPTFIFTTTALVIMMVAFSVAGGGCIKKESVSSFQARELKSAERGDFLEYNGDLYVITVNNYNNDSLVYLIITNSSGRYQRIDPDGMSGRIGKIIRYREGEELVTSPGQRSIGQIKWEAAARKFFLATTPDSLQSF